VIDEEVLVDGVRAIRRRKSGTTRRSQEPYLHLPMACITALGGAGLSAAAWPLALWVLWHHVVFKRPAAVTAAFASRAGTVGRAARRYAVEALEASGLFHVTRNGTRATMVSPSATLKAMVKPSSK
jgi:hypothetical protein